VKTNRILKKKLQAENENYKASLVLMREMKNDNKLRGSPSIPFTHCCAAGGAAVVSA
jgi:hypothetical protein